MVAWTVALLAYKMVENLAVSRVLTMVAQMVALTVAPSDQTMVDWMAVMTAAL